MSCLVMSSTLRLEESVSARGEEEKEEEEEDYDEETKDMIVVVCGLVVLFVGADWCCPSRSFRVSISWGLSIVLVLWFSFIFFLYIPI